MKKFTKLFLVLILGLAIVLPIQASNVNAWSEGREYFFDEEKYVYQMYQYRIDELCPKPAVFSWLDNGIPKEIMAKFPGTNGVEFNYTKVGDRGYGVMDSGYHFHKFYAKMNDGRNIDFWACVDRNKKTKDCEDYECLDKLLNRYY